jgi:hypothetical protein
MRNTALRRRIVSNNDGDSDVVAIPCTGTTMSIIVDIVDEALQVVGGHRGSNDQPYDFNFLPEETFVYTMDPNSSKSTARTYSCNMEGDFFVTLDKNHSR